ncbi:M43 family zinc metalloprotease [Saprospira grandis]|uniref:M43 family zinc metalloprotease n=1 Tax=Saprospira grandis TaxID=1008 RepID=UPI0022DDCD42|nr:M43 family zinc metalloprotease [Saprospira grandis]WBM75189.1 M43 family zinc metalloprotease [Saprospira grandis]
MNFLSFRQIAFCLFLCFSFGLSAQHNHPPGPRNCHAMDVLQQQQQANPAVEQRMRSIEQHTQNFIRSGQANSSRSVITIPVVVHVVYNTTAQNISDAQILSQIQVLNEDFRRTNSDADNKWAQAADTEIEFCLATVDPNGNATTGITRTYTSVSSFSTNDAMKYSSQGGKDAWPTDQYLNMWVCNISGGILGYAQFPGSGDFATDGVVMGYKYFGTVGQATAPFDGGRTATHEVGHWLNLRHIWGDGACGQDDFVGDTPESDAANYGCDAGHRSCGSADMVENYMDYSDDACMNLFTAGQKARMQALFAPGGFRESLLSSNGCGGSTGGGGSTFCTTAISSFPYTEGFESGLGDFSQSSNDDINWTSNNGSTPSSSTGPSAASEATNYLYIEASSPNYPSKVAILNTPCFDLAAVANPEFSFDYHMYGSDMGSLSLQASTDGTSWTNIWSTTGDQGNSWFSATVDLSSYVGEQVQLRFYGSTGTSYTSDMAIDNIQLEDAGGSTGGGTGTVCANTITSFPYTEGFESGLGDWSQNANDDIDWTENSGATGSSSTGPSAASEASTYLYIEASSPNYPSKVAVLNAPCFDLSGLSSPEFSFDYHMYGSDMGTLSLEASTDGTNWSSLWSTSGNQGNSWFSATVDLSSYAGQTVQLRFYGSTGTSYTSDMAIDNIQLEDAGGSTGGGSGCETLNLNINFDNYPGETSWEILDANNTAVASGNSYSGTNHNEDICLPNGCYSFVIYDQYGDGICCSYGNGDYSLTNAQGDLLASGASFGSSETTNFCLSSSRTTADLATKEEFSLLLYPNPAREQLQVELSSEGTVDAQIFDAMGRQIWSGQLQNGQHTVSIDQLADGLYYFTAIQADGQQIKQKFVKIN